MSIFREDVNWKAYAPVFAGLVLVGSGLLAMDDGINGRYDIGEPRSVAESEAITQTGHNLVLSGSAAFAVGAVTTVAYGRKRPRPSE